MSILVILEVEAKDGEVAALLDYASSLLSVTREQDGCIGIDLWIDPARPNTMVAVEEWQNRQTYENYFDWRANSGVIETLLGFAAGQPSIRYLNAVRDGVRSN